MGVRVIRGASEYKNAIVQGMRPTDFDFRLLCEGDSWMDVSGLLSGPPYIVGALPDALATHYAHSTKKILLVNLAHAGDELRQIDEVANAGFFPWLDKGLGLKFDAILLSAGGNDYIDAVDVKFTPIGQGILVDCRQGAVPTTAQQCLNYERMHALRTEWLDIHFHNLYQGILNSPHKDTLVLLNLYDVPTPRFVSAGFGLGPWLAPAYQAHGIPEPLWQEVTNLVFHHLADTVRGWSRFGQPGVIQAVPTIGTLTPAAAGAGGADNDWVNEIHPNNSGWAKLAPVWANMLPIP